MKAAVGASGGLYIIPGATQVFLNHFFLNMDPLSSVMAPRIFHQVCASFFTQIRNFLVLLFIANFFL